MDSGEKEPNFKNLLEQIHEEEVHPSPILQFFAVRDVAT